MRSQPIPRLGSLIVALLLALPAPAPAATFACPDLASAKQVEACPSDAELRYTFIGFCSDNARLYDGKGEVCDDFDRYRALKNIALWESADGVFAGYPSCALAPEAIRAATPQRIAVERKGTITQVACDYAGGVRFTLRSRAACRVDGAGRCDAPEGCRAVCD